MVLLSDDDLPGTSAQSPEAVGPLLPSGALVADRLLVHRRIGAGGLGEVYEVTHKFTRHRRAMKVLHPTFRRDPEVVRRFLDEASAAGRIGNPHIVETFDAGLLSDGSPFLVMEFLEGRPLNEVLHANGRIEPDLAVSMVMQVCSGVQAAHEAGVVHRDLKPENLFLTERNGQVFVKVLDFGVSKFKTEDGALEDSTRSGVTMGTPKYMAPEQLKNAKNADVRSDVFSLGVILYQLLAGRAPFDGESFVDLALRIIGGDYLPLDEVALTIPPGLCAVVHKAMRGPPEERFQSARALSSALAPFARIQAGAPIPGGAPEGATGTQSGTPSKPEVDAQGRGTPAPRDAPADPNVTPFGAAPGLVSTAFGISADVATPPTPAVDPAVTPSPSRRPWALLAGLAAITLTLGALELTKELGRASPEAPRSAAQGPSVAPPPSPVTTAPAVPTGAPASAPSPNDSSASSRADADGAQRSLPPKLGVVDIACRPVQCRVMLDGAPAGETPLLSLPLSAGAHTVVLVNLETHEIRTRHLEVVASERARLLEPF